MELVQTSACDVKIIYMEGQICRLKWHDIILERLSKEGERCCRGFNIPNSV